MSFSFSDYSDGVLTVRVNNIEGGNPHVPYSGGLVELSGDSYKWIKPTEKNVAVFEEVPRGEKYTIDVKVKSSSEAFANAVEHWGLMEDVLIDDQTSLIIFNRSMPVIEGLRVFRSDLRMPVSELNKGDSLKIIISVENPLPDDIPVELLLKLKNDFMDSTFFLKKNLYLKKGEIRETEFYFCPQIPGDYFFAPALKKTTDELAFTDCWDWSQRPLFSVKGNQRLIDFENRQWDVKTGFSPPGPNLYTDDKELIWVDEKGRLNLTLTPGSNKWKATEVISRDNFGYGTYTFFVDSDIKNYASEVVAAIFLYNNEENEIDIEFTRWGNADNPNLGNYVVQPYYQPGNQFSFPLLLEGTYSTHRIIWKADRVIFESWHGHHQHPPSGMKISRYEYAGNDIPSDENVKLHFNIWLFKGKEPKKKQKFSFIVAGFIYEPENN